MSEVEGLAARRRRRRLLWWLVLLIAISAGAAWAVVQRPWEPKPSVVSVETIVAGPASRVLAINGRVAPAEQVEISSTVNGRVVSVAAAEGDEVQQGAPLLVIDNAQQVAALAQVQSQLDSARVQLDQAKTNYERAEALGASISQKARDDARLAVDTTQKEIDRLSALLAQTQSLVGEYTVRAPFTGTILSRGVDPGQVVSSSTPLFLFADLSTLHAEASIDELYASELRRGLPAKARPAGQSRIIDGEVVYVSPQVDTSTGGRLVRVSLPPAGDLDLAVGLTVMLNIVVDQRNTAITIPRSALLQADQPSVYVVEGGKAVLRSVQYIDWPADRLIVTEGLRGGEVLITDSTEVKAAGMAVRPGS